MFKGINHIGIVVKSIDETVEFLSKTLDAKTRETVRFEDAGQISRFVQFGDPKYELMGLIGENGVAVHYLAKHGEGFHHISLLSDDFDGDCACLQAQGVILIGTSATSDMLYAFTYPKTSGGILYEIAGI